MEKIHEKLLSINKNRYISSKDILCRIVSHLIKKEKINKRNILCAFFSMFVGFIMIINSINSVSVINRLNMMIDNANSFAGYIIAGIISGYMLFYAVLTKETIKTFILTDDNEKNKEGEERTLFESINNYFIEILVLVAVFFGINFFIKIFVSLLDAFTLDCCHKLFFFIVYDVYIFLVLNLLLEFICFLFNIYSLILADSIMKVMCDDSNDDGKT
ncbi:MAG: hypothetical protein SPG13_07005 [Peptostreptococcus porci]|uniref:hypothetical protein n=1 Tax=Peptostreptococcus porci TaxID=2652282 RepID=UPI002A75D4A1|nr:hypothetical protein [Peptostreptococcus porci]MDY2793979.1 hypothetical protein [Peptostreptococcus porci]MDY5480195.1 hypothetical protein [Peptostreptococcus porci]